MDITFAIKGIGGHIAGSPTRYSRPKPEVARIRESQLVAEDWQDKQRGSALRKPAVARRIL